MSNIPSQITRIKRDINNLEVSVRKQEKYGNPVKASELRKTIEHLQNYLDQLIAV